MKTKHLRKAAQMARRKYPNLIAVCSKACMVMANEILEKGTPEVTAKVTPTKFGAVITIKK